MEKRFSPQVVEERFFFVQQDPCPTARLRYPVHHVVVQHTVPGCEVWAVTAHDSGPPPRSVESSPDMLESSWMNTSVT